MSIKVGDAFLWPHPFDDKHLMVVITKKVNKVVTCVFVSSIYENQEFDPACIIHKGEHPFVVHDSYVVYDKPLLILEDYLDQKLESNISLKKESCSEEMMDRIARGLHVSEYVSDKMRKTTYGIKGQKSVSDTVLSNGKKTIVDESEVII